MKIYIDGQFYDECDAKISVFDHGLLYGDGVFEGIRIYNGKIFKLDEHVIRLYESAKGLNLEIGMTQEEMRKLLIEAVEINKKNDGYIRLIVTRGDGDLGLDPANCKKSKVIIIVADIKLYPEEYYLNGISIVTSSYRRIPNECFDLRIKSLNYLNNILAKIEARNNNCLECVMMNTEGYVAECTGDNIFIIKNGVMKTPATYYGALEGITREVALELGRKNGLNPQETALTRFDLYNADECFMTGTAAEIIPVIKIDNVVIGEGKPGLHTRKLIEDFKELTK